MGAEADRMAVDWKTLLVLFSLMFLTQTSICQLNHSLQCLNDYNRNISCVWNRTGVTQRPGPASQCTLCAALKSTRIDCKICCELQAVDQREPAMWGCNLFFDRGILFQSFQIWNMSLSCDESKDTMQYKAYDHIRLKPPEKFAVNNSTNGTIISWSPPESYMNDYEFQLQWIRISEQGHQWTGAVVENRGKEKYFNLDLALLEHGARYQARVRIRPDRTPQDRGTWSDWSPVISWVSMTGRTMTEAPDPSSVLEWDFLICTVGGAIVAVTLLVIVLYKTCVFHWTTIKEKMRGPPIPNPSKFFEAWLQTPLTRESLDMLLKPVDISSVEVSTSVDCVVPEWRRSVKSRLQRRWESSSQSNISCFSNPNYSMVDGKLEPCAVDSPYGPVRGHGMETAESKDRCEEEEEEEEEEQEKIQREVLAMFFSSNVVSRGSIQVCDYEHVEKLQTQRDNLRSPDSGMGSWGEEQDSQESMENDMTGRETKACLSPSACGALPGSAPSFNPMNLTFHWPDACLGKRLDEVALQCSSMPLAPSSGGYKPMKEIQTSASTE